jgi:hypothetical protein
MLRPLTEVAREVAPLSVVLADAKFDNEQNHCHVHEWLGAMNVISAKRGKATGRVQGHRAQNARAFASQRALVGRVFLA